MKPIVFVAAAVAALSLTAPAGAHIARPGCTSKLPPRAELACARVNRQHALSTILWARASQRKIRVLDASQALIIGRVVQDHRWLYRVMTARVREAERRLGMAVPLSSDWLTAVRQVQRVFPGSEAWLVSCSGGEGSHGVWVWNGGEPASSSHHGSGAGGWMQYMSGTFWTDYRQAVADARGRGFKVPAGSASWYSATGQALAGGWAYFHARWPGKWTGGGC